MNIDGIVSIFNPQDSKKPAAANAGSGSFAEMIAASVEASGSDGEGAPKTDLDFIREKGFSTYAEEVEKRKMAELRERILNRMGLSEGDLNKMPAEQRAAIEDLIAREIQRRMQADAELEGEDSGNLAGIADMARDIADAGNTGAAGNVLLAVMEARDAPAEDAATRSNLPGEREDTA
ncbi:MAG: hypothetical protein COW30_02175 [Rhodospirillales bacterium CG15_BIG_FIL_POST_REV_8_21_14_020_66_15]|nr:MAG: hypothetical protein COW30_02175 [Rhodospirillales bacterium CG15_BIG_FIL_POST_REV_8_21_14_020_66_15]